MSSRRFCIPFVSLILTAAACSKQAETAPGPTPAPASAPVPAPVHAQDGSELRNVLLITIDACRVDALGCYGQKKPASPGLDALARQGALFENAVTPSPSTLPAHCSILTGTTPPFHGVHADADYRMQDVNVTLAESLKQAGFATGAIVGSSALRSLFDMNQGFDAYDDRVAPTAAGRRSATDAALAWLDSHREGKWFLLLNYQDPAMPYTPPESHRARLGGDVYLGEISYVDARIGRVLDRLDKLALTDSTLVIVAGAHGERAGGHGESRHGYFVYRETTRIPLIVRLPGRPAGLRIQEKVGLIDLAPTVLAAMGVPADAPLHGRDLSPLLAGESTAHPGRYFYSESLAPVELGCNPLFAMEDQSWKYIQSKRPELYDLVRDPGETNNLLAEQPNRAQAMRNQLKQELAATLRITPDGEAFTGGAAALTFDDSGEDPKDLIRVHEMLAVARELADQGDIQGMVSMCDAILKIRPDISRAHELLGAATDLREHVKRGEHFKDAARNDPLSAIAHFEMGNIFWQMRDFPKAEAMFRHARFLAEGGAMKDGSIIKLLTGMGYDPPVRFNATLHLADTLHYRLQFEPAAETYLSVLYTDPLIEDSPFFRDTRYYACLNLAENLYHLQRYDESVNACQDALTIKPDAEKAQWCVERALNAQTLLNKYDQPVEP